MFKNPFSFNGRIRRTEYGISYLIYLVTFYGLSFVSGFYDVPLVILAILPVVWFLLAQGAKRCHDRGNTGWFQIIPFYALWMVFAPGDYGPNEYGLNPKGEGNFEEIDQIGTEQPV